MASIKEEIAAIAADHGYTGPKPKSTAGAIDALADTLAGTDVKSGRSIAGAIHALAPYIGSGGGGGFEPKGLAKIKIGDGLTVPEGDYFLFRVDSQGPLQSVGDAMDYGDVYHGFAASNDLTGPSFGSVGGGLYVALAVAGSNGTIDADKIVVTFQYDAEIENVTKFTVGNNVLLTFQVPESDQGGTGDISIFYDDGGGGKE